MALPEGAPSKNGTHAEWAAFAIGKGVPSYEAWNTGRDELVARYETPDPRPGKAPRVNPQDVGPGHATKRKESENG